MRSGPIWGLQDSQIGPASERLAHNWLTYCVLPPGYPFSLDATSAKSLQLESVPACSTIWRTWLDFSLGWNQDTSCTRARRSQRFRILTWILLRNERDTTSTSRNPSFLLNLSVVWGNVAKNGTGQGGSEFDLERVPTGCANTCLHCPVLRLSKRRSSPPHADLSDYKANNPALLRKIQPNVHASMQGVKNKTQRQLCHTQTALSLTRRMPNTVLQSSLHTKATL